MKQETVRWIPIAESEADWLVWALRDAADASEEAEPGNGTAAYLRNLRGRMRQRLTREFRHGAPTTEAEVLESIASFHAYIAAKNEGVYSVTEA